MNDERQAELDERQTMLEDWLVRFGDAFERAGEMVEAAMRGLGANPDELNWLDAEWRRRYGERPTEEAPTMAQQERPAARAPEGSGGSSTALERPVPRAPQLDEVARLGEWLALAESKDETPKAKGASAALRLYYARELGLKPMAANELSVIGGRLVVSARLLRALAAEAGYRVVPVEQTPESCTAALVNVSTGAELGRASFTLEDATRAGLVKDRSAWITHPARMCWARASAFVVYDYAPEVALGLLIDEELDEVRDVPRAGPAPEPPATESQSGDTQTSEQAEDAEDADWRPTEADTEGTPIA